MLTKLESLDAFSDVLTVLYTAATPAEAAARMVQPLKHLFVGAQVDVIWAGTPGPEVIGRWDEFARKQSPGETRLHYNPRQSDSPNGEIVLAVCFDGGFLGVQLRFEVGSGETMAAWCEHLRPHLAAALAGARHPEGALSETDRLPCRTVLLTDEGGVDQAVSPEFVRLMEKHFRGEWKGSASDAFRLADPIDRWVRPRVLTPTAHVPPGNDATVVHDFNGPAGCLRVRLARGDGARWQLEVREDPRGVDWYRLAARGLSARECEVAYEIAQGRCDGEIAGKFAISVKTVNKHVENILRKLGADNRLGAVHTARVWLSRGLFSDLPHHPTS